MSDYSLKRSTTSGPQPAGHDPGPAVGKTSLVAQAQAAIVQAKRAEEAQPGERAAAPPETGAAAAAPAGGGRPLPPDVRSRMERLMNADFSAVRIHEGPEAAAMGARAFTRGSDIFFAPGELDLTSERGLELLGHELAHVVQQAAGRVQATAQAKGVDINADAGLEQEADAIGAQAARGDAAGAGGGAGGGAAGGEAAGGGAVAQPASAGPAQLKFASPVVQRKGDAPLAPQVPADGAPPGPEIAGLLGQLAAYDASTDGRPAAQLALLDPMIATATGIVGREPKPGLFSGMFSKGAKPSLAATIKGILERERAVVERQRARLERFTRDADAPYEQMTAEGMMWNHSAYDHNTARVGATGKRYFNEMSSRNLNDMQVESATGDVAHPAPVTQEWFAEFVERAQAALSASVVNHYTTSARARTMLDGGRMKSKMMLEKDSPTFKHNTSAYDDLGLANSGFLFFFIEAPDAAMRPTRFAEGDDGARPARISIPIQDSGLLSSGWIMLSDFAQREYPDIQTNAASDRHTSWLPTRAREQRERPENAAMTEQVRHFEPGLSPLTDEDMDTMMDERLSSEQRQATAAVSPQARGDAQSKQVYTGPGDARHEVPDRMLNNILVGGDIIPGLAMRAALEVSRMARVNPTLAETFKALDGAPLMKFMLKDLFRPQAMVPNSVELREEHVQS